MRLNRPRFIVICGMFVVVAIAMTFWLTSRIQFALRAAQESSSNGAIVKIRAAMARYVDEHGHYPPQVLPVGLNTHSWRVLLEQQEASFDSGGFQYDFGAAWNSERNLAFASASKFVPYGFGAAGTDPSSNLESHFFVICDAASAFPGQNTVSPEEVTDAVENTVLVLEAQATGIVWTEPRDFRMKEVISDWENRRRILGSTRHPNGPALLFADFEIYRLRGDVSSTELTAMFTINGGEPVDRDDLVRRGVLVRYPTVPIE